MAAIGNDNNGRKRILFFVDDPTDPEPDVRKRKRIRKTVRVGKVTMRQAEAFKTKIEALVGQQITGAVDDEILRWVVALPDEMHQRLEAVGLVKPRNPKPTATLTGLLDTFFQHLDVKPITRLGYQSTRTSLTGFFGAGTAVREITALQADQWRSKMKSDGLAQATISKRVLLARQIFRKAIQWNMAGENPFRDVKAGPQKNKDRQFNVTREMAQKVLDACPDSQWRLIFALSRFGGLRCPSEHLALKWGDIDFEHGRIRVPSSKTEHHEGKESRIVPMFPELRKPLMEVYGEAAEGTEYVITRYREANCNLRTQLNRIIDRAGLKPWPRLFHNLRSSRQTELAETYPIHVVCAWIGNTREVAEDHYLQVTDAHFEHASVEPERAARNAARSASESGGQGRTTGVPEMQNTR